MSSTVQEVIRKVLKELTENHCENYFKRENLRSLCISIKSMFEWDFNFKEFYNALCNMQHLPLELLWNFHVFQIIPLDTYLSNIKPELSIQNFKESVVSFCIQDCKNDYLYFSQTGLLSFIVSHAFADFDEFRTEEEIKQICRSTVESFLHSIFSLNEKDFSLLSNQTLQTSNSVVERCILTTNLKPFFALWTCGTLDVDSLHLFSYFALQNFLKKLPSSVENAFIPHSSWRNKSDPFHLLPVVEKLVETLKPEELGQILNKAVWEDDTNWKNFSVLITSMSDKGSLITKIVTELVRDGFDHLDFRSIQKAVLIGRQISLKSNDSFSVTYMSWMQTTFWENIQTKSFQVVSLLIQVLSDLVPYEKDLDCIKLFLGKPVNIPQECQSLYSDYMILLKTRVKDLQPHINTENIVEKVLNLFQENGKIPPYILEASLMHKHHYLNEFLPVLLKPRMIPTVPDVKERFIEKLNKFGKIPSYIYQQYKFSCQQKQQNLLAGINLADENCIELTDDNI